MSVSAANWVNELDMMGIYADKAQLQSMLDNAPNDPAIKDDVLALKERLSELS